MLVRIKELFWVPEVERASKIGAEFVANINPVEVTFPAKVELVPDTEIPVLVVASFSTLS